MICIYKNSEEASCFAELCTKVLFHHWFHDEAWLAVIFQFFFWVGLLLMESKKRDILELDCTNFFLTESAQLSKTGIPVYRLIVCHILIWPAHTFIHFTEMTLYLMNRYTALVRLTEIREQLHHFCNSSILCNKGL